MKIHGENLIGHARGKMPINSYKPEIKRMCFNFFSDPIRSVGKISCHTSLQVVA